jgi:hypothetical protein
VPATVLADPAERQPERIACVTSPDVEIPRSAYGVAFPLVKGNRPGV